ncbi:fungal specific transcription factor domain-containing protein [Fusarium phyllophilum]|uniref:Fungal specific transcription factor domain-containing protein n=1 Tax=Fusarium phyllophilum TaxID=47803 RepID=A0A8H5NK23_9HYPO|nr:fungal specific transcription factor domain-containing protein [Fusarium phyllophilum]
MFKEPLERKMAIRMFWSVHTLDRRWSFGSGLLFIIQSNDIDSNISWPDDEVPYLHGIVAYNRIGAKVWVTLYNAGSSASNVPRDEIEFLHYSVERWYKEIPTILKLPEYGAPTLGRGHHRLQILLYLRACQMKILLHQSALHAITRPATPQPSSLILATPNTSRESPQASEAWLNNGIMADRACGFGILDEMEMTLSLDGFLTAAENDDGLWGTSLSPGSSDPLVQGTLNPSIDLARLDFSQILDGFL